MASVVSVLALIVNQNNQPTKTLSRQSCLTDYERSLKDNMQKNAPKKRKSTWQKSITLIFLIQTPSRLLSPHRSPCTQPCPATEPGLTPSPPAMLRSLFSSDCSNAKDFLPRAIPGRTGRNFLSGNDFLLPSALPWEICKGRWGKA